MMPIGPLMVEHRLIERMIALVDREAKRIRATGKVDTDFVLSAIDFIRLYADRCHHGKEEDILFRALKEKPLPANLRAVLEELEAEHAQGRRTAARMALVRERVLMGDKAAVRDLAALMEDVARFYPLHIAKEDQAFFLPCMEFLSAEEQARLLEEGFAFDQRLLHTHFEALADVREGKPPAPAAQAVPLEGADARAYGCMVCGYTHDPRLGDPTQRIPPGTPFNQLPESWICPHCHANLKVFLTLQRP